MGALRYLVDTSVLSRLRHREVQDALLPLIAARSLARTTITDLEVGFSARNAREWDELIDSLAIAEPLDVLDVDLHRALAVQCLLAARHQRGRKLPDLLVSAVAERRRMAVLHYDHDFDLIAEVTGQASAWVVPAGTLP